MEETVKNNDVNESNEVKDEVVIARNAVSLTTATIAGILCYYVGKRLGYKQGYIKGSNKPSKVKMEVQSGMYNEAGNLIGDAIVKVYDSEMVSKFLKK